MILSFSPRTLQKLGLSDKQNNELILFPVFNCDAKLHLLYADSLNIFSITTKTAMQLSMHYGASRREAPLLIQQAWATPASSALEW
jgi:hypothetical protein